MSNLFYTKFVVLIGIACASSESLAKLVWTRLVQTVNGATVSVPVLLTDGTVMVSFPGDRALSGSPEWFRLTPASDGEYVTGKWKQLATMESTYQPLYFASVLLPNGQVIVDGGAINTGAPPGPQQNNTAVSELYDPVANTWQNVPSPDKWTTIGDAQSVVMPAGTYMLANCCTHQAATLDLKHLTWKPVSTGKADINQYEGWTLLPTGQILTVDTNNIADPRHSELLTNGVWASAGDTPKLLADIGTDTNTHQMGPQILRPDGTVVAIGATGRTAIYAIKSSRWTSGPNLPSLHGEVYDSAPGPAVLLPDGDILFGANIGIHASGPPTAPTVFFLFTAQNKIVKIAQPPFSFAGINSFYFRALMLPNGQAMVTGSDEVVELFTPSKPPLAQYAPRIAKFPATVTHGETYRLAGRYLNGFSAATAYGAASQSATNYPLVRITNIATGTVTYARTSNFSSMAVANPDLVTTDVTIPASIETGPSTVVVVTSGNPSTPINVTVN